MHTIIGKIRSSYYLGSELKKLCSGLLKETKNLKLLSFVVTRWNSKYYMLKRLLSLKEPIEKLLHQEKDIVEELECLLISESEWTMISILVDFLSLYNTCSKYMEGEYPTFGYSISLYYRLWEHSNKYNRDDVQIEYLLKFEKGVMEERLKIEKYYGTGSLFSFGAMIFDIRIKDSFYNKYLWIEEKNILISK